MGERTLALGQETAQAALLRGTVPTDLNSGYGDGSGYGYGYGSGSGDGDGSGSGYGYGSGSGYGDGSGYGYGYGSGSGDGDGSGSGYGSGSGDGSKEYWLACIKYFAAKWPQNMQARLSQLKNTGATIAFWRSDKSGQPSNNGGKIEAAAPGVIHTAPGPINVCNKGTLHATLIPPKWKGDRWWIVAMTGEVQWQEDKCGALSREIIGECT